MEWSWVPGLAGVVVGGLLGGVIGARNEHRQWLRDQRLATYTALLDAFIALRRYFNTELRAADRSDEDWGEALARWTELEAPVLALHTRVGILGGGIREGSQEKFRKVLSDMTVAVQAKASGTTGSEGWDSLFESGLKVIKQFEEACRKELRIS